MHEWLLTVLYGIVEGITEFLPISSTGHLIIVEYFCGSTRTELFNVAIQAGALLSVVFIYWDKLKNMFLGWTANAEYRDEGYKVAWAFVLTSIGGLIAKKLGFELPENPWPVAITLIVGGLIIFAAEWRISKGDTHDRLTWAIVTVIGLAQILAIVFPGASRSGACIIFAMLLGLNRVKATEFSFIVGIPTMFAATAYSFYHYIKHDGMVSSEMLMDIVLGFVVSFAVAFVVVKWLLRYVQTHTLNAFAIYRILLGGLILILLS